MLLSLTTQSCKKNAYYGFERPARFCGHVQIWLGSIHNAKTRADNPLMAKKAGETRSLRVIATHIETDEESHFQLLSDAGQKLGLQITNICANLKGRYAKVGKYKFRADPAYVAEHDDIPGDEWRDILEDRAVAYGIPAGLMKKVRVSNMGRIQNKKGRRSFGIKEGKESDDSYMRAFISTSGYRPSLPVHVLCALAFVGERPSPDHTVDHIDRRKNNNRCDNLRWSTRLEQGNQSNNRSVHQIDMETRRVIRTYVTMSEAARALSIPASGIWHAANGAMKYSRGYYWEFAT